MNIENIKQTCSWFQGTKQVFSFKGEIKGKRNWRVAFTEVDGVRSPICYFHKVLGGTFVYNQSHDYLE